MSTRKFSAQRQRAPGRRQREKSASNTRPALLGASEARPRRGGNAGGGGGKADWLGKRIPGGEGYKTKYSVVVLYPKQVVLSKSVVVCGNEGRGAPRAGARSAAAVGMKRCGAKRRPTLATCAVCEQRCASNANKPLDKGGGIGEKGAASLRATPLGAKRRLSARSDAPRLRVERSDAPPPTPHPLQPLGRGDVECMVDPSPRAGKTISQVALGV